MDTTEPLPFAARPLRWRLVDALAQFAKSLSIYPASNSRVVGNLEVFFRAFAELQAEGRARPIRMLFGGEHLRIDGEEHAVESGQVNWLRERFEQTALAGLQLAPELGRNSVVAFCRLLLENFARGDKTSFERMWSAAPPDVQPIERRFDGAFTGIVSDLDLDGTAGETNELAGVLVQDEEIQKLLADLQQVLEPDKESPRLSIDLLGHITRLLPADVMTDLSRVVSTAQQVLEELILKLGEQPATAAKVPGGPDPAGPEGVNEQQLERLLTMVARGLFARADANLPAAARALSPADRAVRGHEGDENITDDLPSFLREYRSLPDFETEAALFRPQDTHAEQVGVFLHYLLQDDGQLRSDALQEHILALLATDTPAVQSVLEEYVDLLRSPQGRASIHTGRLMSVLRESRLAGILKERGIVGAQSVLETFPEDFGLYLDALDLGREQDQAELASVCSCLGDDLILGNGQRLVREEELLKYGRAESILAAGHPELVALVLVILQHSGDRHRQMVVEYLRSLELADPEACLLAVADGLEYFPREYLAALMDRRSVGDRKKSGKLRQWVSMMLCRYARNDLNDEARRIYAIRLLPDFWEDEAMELLKNLAKQPLLGAAGTSPAVRKAARETLTSMGAD
jgi:hypothetical protein